MNGRTSSYISAAQIRAGRALLNWSQEDLAHKSSLSVATVRKLELGHISPRGQTTGSILQTFEDAGLEFMDSDGVRQRPDDIKIYHGHEGTLDFFDDVYNTAKHGDDIVVVCPSEAPISAALGDAAQHYYERMTALKNKMSMRCIITEDYKNLPPISYCDYRYISKHYVNSVPFYIYGDHYALFVFNANPSPKITVLRSREVVAAFRLQFQSMWDKGTPLHVSTSVDPNSPISHPTKKRKA